MRIALIAALSLLALTPAFATEGAPGGANDHNGRAEITTGPRSMIATDGPGSPGDNTGHALVIDPHQMFAEDGPPGGPGDRNGRAELSIDPHLMLAGGLAGGIEGSDS